MHLAIFLLELLFDARGAEGAFIIVDKQSTMLLDCRHRTAIDGPEGTRTAAIRLEQWGLVTDDKKKPFLVLGFYGAKKRKNKYASDEWVPPHKSTPGLGENNTA